MDILPLVTSFDATARSPPEAQGRGNATPHLLMPEGARSVPACRSLLHPGSGACAEDDLGDGHTLGIDTIEGRVNSRETPCQQFPVIFRGQSVRWERLMDDLFRFVLLRPANLPADDEVKVL